MPQVRQSVPGPKKMGEAQRSFLLSALNLFLLSSSIFTTARQSCSICLFKADPQLHAKIFPLCASLWVGESGC